MKVFKKAVGIALALAFCLQYFGIHAAVTRTPQKSITTPKTTRATTAEPRSTQAKSRALNCTPNTTVDLSDPRQAVNKHPVSRLFEIQAKNHEKEPIFKVIAHRGKQSENNQDSLKCSI